MSPKDFKQKYALGIEIFELAVAHSELASNLFEDEQLFVLPKGPLGLLLIRTSPGPEAAVQAKTRNRNKFSIFLRPDMKRAGVKLCQYNLLVFRY